MSNNKKAGFVIIEIIIASAIMGTVFFAIMVASQKFLSMSSQSLKLTQASFILEEGAEAVKTIRDDNWNTLSGVQFDIPYYLLFLNNKWTLTQTEQKNGIFTRSIRFSRVYRNSSDAIAPSGTIDNGTILVKVSVAWQSGASYSKDMYLYVSNIFN